MSDQADIKSFREMAERFAKKELEPAAVDMDNYPFVGFNEGALSAARDTGLLNVILPEKHCGVGQGMEVLCEMLVELAKADGSFASIVLMNAMAHDALCQWGAEGVQEKLAGKSIIGMPAYDLPTDIQTGVEAARDGDGWKLSGTAEYVALAPVADALIVPAKNKSGVSFFIVDVGAEGVKVSEPVVSLGLRGCPAADVIMEDAKLSADSLLCEEAEKDFPVLAGKFRPAAAALSVGVCEGSYNAAKAYALERYQAGSMIIQHDMVRQMLVGMAVVAETGKELVRSMARAVDSGRPWPISSAGLIMLSEQAARATTDGVQCLGGYGYMEDYGQEKRMRDAKQIECIFGGAPAKRLELMEEILRQEE